MQGLKLIVLLTTLSQLGACAIMSKKECLNADWERVGYAVGADGNRSLNDAFLQRQEACAKHGAIANKEEFIAGHKQGIEYFCSEFNAVELGVRGRSSAIDNHTCPENEYPGFRQNFRAGYKLYTLNQDVYRVESYVSDLKNRQYGHKRRIREINKLTEDDSLTPEQCRSLENERARLRQYIHEISYDISSYDSQLYEVRARARRYRDYLDTEYLDPLLHGGEE